MLIHDPPWRSSKGRKQRQLTIWRLQSRCEASIVIHPMMIIITQSDRQTRLSVLCSPIRPGAARFGEAPGAHMSCFQHCPAFYWGGVPHYISLCALGVRMLDTCLFALVCATGAQ